MSYNLSPNQKSAYKSPGKYNGYETMKYQSTAAGSKGFDGRETVFSLQSSTSQPLRYSTSQYQQSHNQEREQPLSHSKLRGSSANLGRSQVSVERVQQPAPHHSGEDVRDRIINQYKDEIKTQSVRERDFQHLEALIVDLQRRSRALEGGIEDSQKEFEERLNAQSKAINHHQADVEALKKNIHDKQSEGINIHEDIGALKGEIELKNSDIYKTQRDLENTRAYNDQLKREIEFIQQDIYKSQDHKKKQQQVSYQLKNEIRIKEKEVEDSKIRVQILEKEQKTLIDRTHHLNEQLDNKAIQLDKTSLKCDTTQREVADLSAQINSLDIDINEVERLNDRHIEIQKKLLRQKDSEIIRGQEMVHHLKEREQQSKQCEIEVEMLKKDLDGVRYGNEALLDRNHELKDELDSLSSHADLLTQQNKELQRELDNFVETDDIVRRNLDRKDKVYMIRSKVDEVIKKSQMDMAARSSPVRGRSPHLDAHYLSANAAHLGTSNSKPKYHGESINARGSPLRRQHF